MSVILQTDVNYMRFVHFLLNLKQIHNLKNRVFPHIISDYMENPRPTFFVNSLENFRHFSMLLQFILKCYYSFISKSFRFQQENSFS
jgi:hypothetical protein